MKDQENIVFRPIPENYSTGINILGFNFKFRNLLEGIIYGLILGGTVALIVFSYTFNSMNQLGTVVGLIIAFGGAGFILGVTGINDEPVSEFVLNAIRYKTRKRMAFYNPHVKPDCIPYFIERQSRYENMPIEKLRQYMAKYRQRIEDAEIERMMEYQSLNSFDNESLYFKDDVGYLDKPLEYMNDREFARYQAKVRKEEKKRLKMAKIEARKRQKTIK